MENKTNQQVITVFGSSSEQKGTQLFQDAEFLGYELSKQGFIIRSGAQDNGGGLMSAVSIGAERAIKETGSKNDIQGVTLNRYWGKEISQCTQAIDAENIGIRTELLCQGVNAFIVLPGGKGTLLELVYLMNGRESDYKDENGKPYVDYYDKRMYVYGEEWKRVLENLVENMQFLDKKVLDTFVYVNSAQQILDHIQQNKL